MNPCVYVKPVLTATAHALGVGDPCSRAATPTWRLDVWLLSGPAVPIMGDLLRYTVAPIISLAIL